MEEETSARRAGLALHRREQKEERKSLRHSSFLSTNLSVSAFSSSPFSHRIWTHSLFFPFSAPLLDSSHCLSFSFLSRLYMSSSLSSFSSIAFMVLYLASAPSFHFCLFVCVLTIFSLLHLFTGKELGVRSVPVQSRLCHPTERVGVKHRHRHSLPGRWHHI